MDDTNKKVRDIYQTMMMKKTGFDRLMISFSMFDFSKKIAMASILDSMPNLAKNELKQKIFLKFYGSDYSIQEKDKIVNYLEKKDNINE